MHSVKEQLEITGHRILHHSRNEIYLSMRFMDIALSMMPYEMNLSTTTVGMDGIKILFNPRHLIDLFRESSVLVNRVYMHMLLHGIFGHVYGMGNRNETYWHLACDIAVASILDELPAVCVRQEMPDFHRLIFEELKKEIHVLNAESIYRVLTQTPISGKQLEMLKSAFIVDDHQFWQQQDDDDQQQQEQRQQNQNDWQKISEKTQTNMETIQKSYGEEAGDLLYQLRIHHREHYDLEGFLKKFTVIKEEIKTDDDSFDYVFYTYGLTHYGNMPLIEPLEYKEEKKIQDLIIVIDTSESCDINMVKQFLSVIYDVIKNQNVFFKRINLHILQCDINVTKDDEIHSLDELEGYMSNIIISGGGGTDFRPAFAYIDQLKKQGQLNDLKGVLYFTDGYGRFPEKMPAYETAFIFLDESGNDIKVPAWAMKIILTSMDFDGRLR